jgi:hypothetical protein
MNVAGKHSLVYYSEMEQTVHCYFGQYIDC